MSRYDDDGARQPTTVFELAAWHYAVVATCRGCTKETVFDPRALWWLCQQRGWSDNIRDAARRFKCEGCGGRATMTWSHSRQPTVLLPLPDEREWKRAVNRFRG